MQHMPQISAGRRRVQQKNWRIIMQSPIVRANPRRFAESFTIIAYYWFFLIG
jgi:hypothetical protein